MCTVLVGYQYLLFSEHPFVICPSFLLFTPIIISLCLWYGLARSTGYCHYGSQMQNIYILFGTSVYNVFDY